MAAHRPRDGRPVPGRPPLLPCGPAGGPPRNNQHGHPRGRGDDRGVGLQRARHVRARSAPVGRHRTPDLLRQLDRDHRPNPDGSMAGGSGQGPDRRGGQGADRAAGTVGADREGRRRDRRPARGSARRRSRARAPGRARTRRRARGGWRFGGRRVDADRRADPRREGPRIRGDRRDHERPRDLYVPGNPCRARHRPGADRGSGPPGAGVQGADPAAGRPDRRGLRSDRPGRGRCHFLAVVHPGPRAAPDSRSRRVHHGGRHRLPVRHGPRDSDGDHGRDRQRRGSGDPDPRRRSARAGGSGRRRHLRQDGHVDSRPSVAGHGRGGRGLHAGRGPRSGGVGGAAPARATSGGVPWRTSKPWPVVAFAVGWTVAAFW